MPAADVSVDHRGCPGTPGKGNTATYPIRHIGVRRQTFLGSIGTCLIAPCKKREEATGDTPEERND